MGIYRDLNLNPDNFLGCGVDSVVYKDGNGNVVKIYGLGTNVYLYKEVTNRAAIIKKVAKFGKHGKLEVNVVRTSNLIESPSGQIAAIAPESLGTKCSFDIKSFKQPLELIAVELNNELGVDGICISPVNARFDLKRKKVEITDLCDDITQLKPRTIRT